IVSNLEGPPGTSVPPPADIRWGIPAAWTQEDLGPSVLPTSRSTPAGGAPLELRRLVSAGQRDADAFLRHLLAQPLELLVLADFDGTVVPHALQFAGRVLHVGLHQVPDGLADRDQHPGPFGVVVHEQII